MSTPEPQSLLELRLDELLENLAGDAPAPASGSVAALVVAAAAALVAMVARRSPDWADGPGIAAQAEMLRLRAVELVDSDAVALAEARALLAGDGSGDGDRALGGALGRAADIPLQIGQLAADVGALAAVAAEHGGDSHADAAAAAALAAGAALAAAHLVEVNLGVVPGDERTGVARSFAAWGAASAEQALGAASAAGH